MARRQHSSNDSRLRWVAWCLLGLIAIPIMPSFGADAQVAAGERLFQRNCGACHLGSDYGPPLNKNFLQGREDAVRTRILEGGIAMPGMKYKLQPSQMDAIMAYLRQLEATPPFVGTDRADP